MANAITDPVQFYDEVWNGMTGWLKQRRFKFAKSVLENRLSEIVRSANQQKKKGKKPGHDAFRELYRQMDTAINSFCQQWQIERVAIESEYSEIGRLRLMTQPVPEMPAIAKLAGAIFAAVAVPVLLGVLWGLVHVGHFEVVKHFIH